MRQMWWLRVASLMLGLTAVPLLLLIVLGVFDPEPVGKLTGTAIPHTLTISPQHKDTFWLPEPLPPGNFTVRATVTHQSGELDSGAGLVLGDGCMAVIIAISPLGYATIQDVGARQVADELSCQSNDTSPTPPLPFTAMPWQPWPHVHTGSEPNEVWIDVVDEQMRVRLNRELLWAGHTPIQPTQVGVYGESFGDTAVFRFSEIGLFYDNLPNRPHGPAIHNQRFARNVTGGIGQ